MTAELSILDLFLQAGLLVKIVMLTLLGMSVASWAMIIKRSKVLSVAIHEQNEFEDAFWSTQDLSQLYQKVKERKDELTGLEEIFYSGFTEFARLRRTAGSSSVSVMEGTGRAMRVAVAREVESLETNLPFSGDGRLYQPIYRPVWYSLGYYECLYCPW